MGLEELIKTLKKNEQKQIDDIWQAVREEAEALRTEVAAAIAAITKKQEQQLASACQKSRRAIFSETETKTRERKLLAYQALDRILWQTAFNLLPTLRLQAYADVFKLMAAELPAQQWEKITVNPEDVELAAGLFARDAIHPDPSISGGLLAEALEGRIVVDNTFEKRLARKWPHLLPGIITYIEKRYGTDGFAATDS